MAFVHLSFEMLHNSEPRFSYSDIAEGIVDFLLYFSIFFVLCSLQSSYGYGDFFSDTWKAFTRYPIIRLNEYDNKKVSFFL